MCKNFHDCEHSASSHLAVISQESIFKTKDPMKNYLLIFLKSLINIMSASAFLNFIATKIHKLMSSCLMAPPKGGGHRKPKK